MRTMMHFLETFLPNLDLWTILRPLIIIGENSMSMPLLDLPMDLKLSKDLCNSKKRFNSTVQSNKYAIII